MNEYVITNPLSISPEHQAERAQRRISTGISVNRYDQVKIAIAFGSIIAAEAVEITSIGFLITFLNENDPQIDKGLMKLKYFDEKWKLFENLLFTYVEFVSSSLFAGMLIGGCITSIISDQFGRRSCLIMSLILNFVFGVLSACIPSFLIMSLCRVFQGFGIGGAVPIAFAMAAELFPENLRGTMLTSIASFWMIGSLYTSISAWIMFGNDFQGNRIIPNLNWQWYVAISTLPAGLCLLLSWLSIHNLPIHKTSMQSRERNGSQSSFYGANIVSISFKIISISFIHLKYLCVTYASQDLRIKASLFAILWFTLSFGTYSILTWISTIFDKLGFKNPYAYSILFSLGSLPGNIISILFVDRVGKRLMTVCSIFLSVLALIAFTTLRDNVYFAILFATVFNAISVVAWNCLDAFTAEFFPSSIRATSMGLMSATSRIGSIVAQIVNFRLANQILWLLFVACSCTCISGISAFCLPNLPANVENSESNDRLDISGDLYESVELNELSLSIHTV
jgi:MFS transporter, VNT family, synaptic vesicle glycoprotein 2